MSRLRRLFLAPSAALLAVTMAAPLAIVCVYSFLSRGAYGGVERPFTFENYARLWDLCMARFSGDPAGSRRWRRRFA